MSNNAHKLLENKKIRNTVKAILKGEIIERVEAKFGSNIRRIEKSNGEIHLDYYQRDRNQSVNDVLNYLIDQLAEKMIQCGETKLTP